ncbi:tetratricopeptide repeat protein, partial [Streptomyces sp. JV184]|uniref:tetratricopeptide repeat protein n=1 Tax=Streptomyces sp. JV184 TaxID=858637 RepID=UPI002E783D6D
SCRMARDVVSARTRLLGADHPDTLVSLHEVAVGLGRLGRWADALQGYRYVAPARERDLGPDHPDALAARHDVPSDERRVGPVGVTMWSSRWAPSPANRRGGGGGGGGGG